MLAFIAAISTCLVPTTGPTVDDEGNDSAAGIAIAAHIYPASKNGPRKRDGLTPEQIRNISNGIWLCRTHGTLIDDFQDEFPAEKVIEMKKVREFAQWLSLKLPDVAFFVGFPLGLSASMQSSGSTGPNLMKRRSGSTSFPRYQMHASL
ncbi:HNH endonuclease [Pseudomonas aeruginosa]